MDWSNSSIIYAGIQNGVFYRSTDGRTSITGISTPTSRAWVTPWCQDPAVAATIYAATDKVYQSTDRGTTWTAAGGAIPGIGRFTVLEVSQNPRFIYAGNGNKFFRTKDGGVNGTDVTAGLPVASNYLTAVAIHDCDPDIAYVTFSGYSAGEKVYKTCNGGTTWTNIICEISHEGYHPIGRATNQQEPPPSVPTQREAGLAAREPGPAQCKSEVTNDPPHSYRGSSDSDF